MNSVQIAGSSPTHSRKIFKAKSRWEIRLRTDWGMKEVRADWLLFVSVRELIEVIRDGKWREIKVTATSSDRTNLPTHFAANLCTIPVAAAAAERRRCEIVRIFNKAREQE